MSEFPGNPMPKVVIKVKAPRRYELNIKVIMFVSAHMTLQQLLFDESIPWWMCPWVISVISIFIAG